mmetsp:Transcript_18670/g.52156  ORF Transcript_18670/g.52156 Transcript_18670/m.52156 type:complete len:108 (+) Transcript_18670:1435-1758(+)
MSSAPLPIVSSLRFALGVGTPTRRALVDCVCATALYKEELNIPYRFDSIRFDPPCDGWKVRRLVRVSLLFPIILCRRIDFHENGVTLQKGIASYIWHHTNIIMYHSW